MKYEHRIIIGDSRNLDMIENNTIQTLVTSPPYNMGGFQRNTGGKQRRPAYKGYDDNLSESSYRAMLESVLYQCTKKIKDNGCIFWNMKSRRKNKEVNPPFWFLDIAKEYRLYLTNIIIWEFPSGGDTTYTQFWGRYEFLFYFRMDKNNYVFYPENIRVPTKYSKDPRYNVDGKNPSNVWHFDYKEGKENTFEFTPYGQIWYITQNLNYGDKHPATYPSELAKRCILATTNKGDTVLDPFLGSGTTSYAAKKLCRNSVGVEISKAYLSLILQNLNYYQKDLSMFSGDEHKIIIEPEGLI